MNPALADLRLAAELAQLDVEEIVSPKKHHTVIDGMRIHHLDWGSHGCSSLLFLHGGRMTAHSWDLVCLALRANFHCIAVDQRGHGDSEWSPTLDYGLDAHVRDVCGLILRLRLTKPVLIGQSLGGLVALSYASRASDRLAGVVAVDVSPEVEAAGTQRLIDLRGDPDPGTLEGFVRRRLASKPARDSRLVRHTLLQSLRQLPDRKWTWKYDQRRLTAEHFAGIMASLGQLRHRAQMVTCPVLVVRGSNSDVLTATQAADFATALPNGRWTQVPSSGHNIQTENPAGLIEALSDFLADIAH